MKNKWYIQTWFIAILFALSFISIIFPIVGIVLILFQTKESNRLYSKYGDYDKVSAEILSLNSEYAVKRSNLEKEYADQENLLSKKYADLESSLSNKLSHSKKELEEAESELGSLNSDLLVAHYNFSDYDGITSVECKNKLSILKTKEQEFIKSDKALVITSDGSKKEINANKKQILRCFNTECDNLLVNLTCKNIDTTRNKMSRSFETLNKIFSVDGICMSNELLEMKLEELNLVYTFELKKEQEKEQQKAIKEQMIEEEKVRREIEKQKAKIEKDQTQCTNEINKLMSYMQKSSNDIEKQLYIDKIRELEDKLKDLEKDKATVLEREANARAGFVYVISNVGSFGENIYKIGMTRRLEPMDRIKELSSASVPFEFDVHAMIFSDDAPALENILHKKFEERSVNLVNLRKEFFNVSIEEIETVVKENFNNTVTFIKIPAATEYRQTLELRKK